VNDDVGTPEAILVDGVFCEFCGGLIGRKHDVYCLVLEDDGVVVRVTLGRDLDAMLDEGQYWEKEARTHAAMLLPARWRKEVIQNDAGSESVCPCVESEKGS